MTTHLIVGAGPVGTATASRLAAQGHDVRIVTRQGTDPHIGGVTAHKADAADQDALVGLATGASVIYNCANPPYNKWATAWPPLAASLLNAAERSGAVLATMSNLYGYGPVDHPMVESDPLAATGTKGRVRAEMWNDALQAHEAGRARVTEIRASDFFGPGFTNTSLLGERVIPKVLAGKKVSVLGSLDQPHSLSYIDDVAEALVTVGSDPRAWGRAWHVPSAPALTQREAISAVAQAAGVPTPQLSVVPRWALRSIGLFSPVIRELDEVAYQVEGPFIIDDRAMRDTFGLEPTGFSNAVAATVRWWRERQAVAA